MSIWTYDTETDGLLHEATKFHCLVFKKYGQPEWVAFIDFHHPQAQDVLSADWGIEWYKIGGGLNLFLQRKDVTALVCHNQYAFDLPMMKQLELIDHYDVDPDVVNKENIRLYDSLAVSRILWPDRPLPPGCPSKVPNPVTGKMDTVGSHGLMAWGYRVANAKPEVHDWRDQPLNVYVHRCIEDVKINELAWAKLMEEASDVAIKGGWQKALRSSCKGAFLMAKQEMDGACFDRDGAVRLLQRVDEQMAQIASEIEPKLPPRQLPKSQRKEFPKHPFKESDGSISSEGFKHLGRLGYHVIEEMVTGPRGGKAKKVLRLESEEITEQAIQDLRDRKMHDQTEPMRLANQRELKEWLVEQGWIPMFLGTRDVTQKDKTTPYTEEQIKQKIVAYIDEMRESPFRPFVEDEMEVDFNEDYTYLHDKLKKQARFLAATPKFKDERGDLCPNLEALEGDLAKGVVLWLSLRNRRSVIKAMDEDKTTGWLNNPRLDRDGRIGAAYSGLTNTNRLKHRGLVNVPKAEDGVVLGKEMRALWTSP